MEQPKPYPFTISAADRERVHHRADVFAVLVAPIYSLLNWKWGYGAGAVPKEVEIARQLHDMVNDVLDNRKISTSTGGLWVGWTNDDDFGISFDVAENYFGVGVPEVSE